jgi:hypothetical protein
MELCGLFHIEDLFLNFLSGFASLIKQLLVARVLLAGGAVSQQLVNAFDEHSEAAVGELHDSIVSKLRQQFDIVANELASQHIDVLELPKRVLGEMP